jgi:pimeloyl-ACP methyl ester carboxylesterase
MGFSMGVPYALGYAILHSSRVAGMILGDYPARHPALDREWITKTHSELGERAPLLLLTALQRDSGELPLWADLPVIDVPVLLLRGDQPGSLLSAEDVSEYLIHLSQAMALVFPGSGHELWEPDRDRYLGTIRAFLEGLDEQARLDDDHVE